LSAVPTAVVSAGATAVVTTAFPLPTARAWLGIAGSDVGGVATVGEVKPDSPAAAAGLLVDDQVLAVDRDPVEGMQDLVAAIGRYAPGDQCILTLRRDGQAVDVTVVLGGST
jgi:S1-C subfamily serine protease